MTTNEAIIAAGYVKLSRSAGECGEEITTRKNLIGLACEKPALWQRGEEPPVCVQHARLLAATI